jgi:putative mRNA 3-end processing factor
VSLLVPDGSGLFCARGGFHVDPVKPVPRAVFTGEHRIEGCGEVFLPAGPRALGELSQGGLELSFHPSGFAPGAAQLRLMTAEETCVVTGDWKGGADPLCAPFETLPCDALVTEAPFGLPIFRWEEPGALAEWLLAHERCALFAAPILALRLQAQLGVPLRRHEDLSPLARRYEELGARVPPSDPDSKRLLAPVASREGVKLARGTVTALAQGSARIRGTRRRSHYDRGFALSEHAAWSELLAMIDTSRARRVLVRAQHAEPLARFLREERGLAAEALA